MEEIHCQPLDGNGCPISKKFSYEEYDHKKQPPRRTGPRMDLSGIEGKSRSESSGTQMINKERKSRGHTNIKYEDDDLTPENLLSKYKSNKKYNDDGNSVGRKTGATTSLSDAIELARKNLDDYSSRENLNVIFAPE